MSKTLRVLNVEDSVRDVELLRRHLSRAGYDLFFDRVDTAEGMRAALEKHDWDIILCDYSMPRFNAIQAIEVLKQVGLDIPFIIISGTVGESVAVEAMRAGAHDYLMKDNLLRLIPTIERELQEAENRRARRRAEAALLESEDRYRDLVEHSHDLICTHDMEGKVLSVNETAARILGYSRESLLGRNIKDALLPEFRCAFSNYIEEILKKGIAQGLMIVQTRTGESRVWEYTNTLRTDGVAAPIVRGMARDVTAQRMAEEALRKAEEKYRSIFENAVEGIFQSTLDGRFIAVNPAMANILGYESPEELMADRTDINTQHYVDSDSRVELERLIAEQGVVKGFECEVFRKDGSKIWTVENVRAIRNQQGEMIYYEGSIEDITARKMLEDQLRQSQKMEAVGQLAGGIAHDFNNLLTVITGYSELSLMQLKDEDPLRRNIEELKRAGDRAAALTRQLLAFSRKQILQPKVLDLNVVVSELEKMLRRVIGEDIELRTFLEPELGSIKADPGQIEQVIMNLSVNARDAMPEGGKLTIESKNVYLDEGYISRHIAINPGPYVMLAISDTGSGMDEETQNRIFEPFFTTKDIGKGTGLGLSTVYGIVKQSGGHIWVYSELGLGTVFKVYLPRIDEGLRGYKRGAELEGSLQGVETILLAEDEGMVRKLARDVLETYGYKVLEASNGGAALLICEQHNRPIHLLITDVIMPEMSGRTLADRLAQLRREMKVLYMSGYTDNAIVHQGVLDEQTHFIQKPFTPDALARKVREVLDRD